MLLPLERTGQTLMRETDSFEYTWNKLQRYLKVGATIRYWGAHRSCTGGAFQVASVDSKSVTVSGEKLSRARIIPKKEWERLFSCWPGYCKGTVTRKTCRNLSWNTAYVFSILRWLETQS